MFCRMAVVCTWIVAASSGAAQNVCPHYVWMHHAGYCSYYATAAAAMPGSGTCGEPVNFDSANCSLSYTCGCYPGVEDKDNPVSISGKELQQNGYPGTVEVWLDFAIPISRVRSRKVLTTPRDPEPLRSAVDDLTVIRRSDKLISFVHPVNGEVIYAQVVTAVVVPPESAGMPSAPVVLRRGFQIQLPLVGPPELPIESPLDAPFEGIYSYFAALSAPVDPDSIPSVKPVDEAQLSPIRDRDHALLYNDSRGPAVVLLNHETTGHGVTTAGN